MTTFDSIIIIVFCVLLTWSHYFISLKFPENKSPKTNVISVEKLSDNERVDECPTWNGCTEHWTCGPCYDRQYKLDMKRKGYKIGWF